jgi:hypothetical protein
MVLCRSARGQECPLNDSNNRFRQTIGQKCPTNTELQGLNAIYSREWTFLTNTLLTVIGDRMFFRAGHDPVRVRDRSGDPFENKCFVPELALYYRIYTLI